MSASRHEIISTVSQVCDVPQAEIFGRDKHHRVRKARQLAAYFLRKAGWSYPQAGEMLAGMHHTTVMNAVHRVRTHPEQYEPHLSQLTSALSGAAQCQ